MSLASEPRELGASPARLRTVVTALCEDHAGRSSSRPSALDRAADYLAGQFDERGIPSESRPFESAGRTWRNLIARLGPERDPRIVVGAHYDAVDGCPGADDNASGVAGLLELGRLLAEEALERRVELAAYALEEPPFFRTDGMGSYAHARRLREEGARVEGMLALEMIGYFSDREGSQRFPLYPFRWFYPTRANFVVIAGRWGQGALVRRVREAMDEVSGVPVESITAPRILPGIDFSDHFSFYRAGFRAAMITDTAFYRNPHYHRPTDTPETLDYARMAEVVDGVAAAVRDLAGVRT